MGVVVLLLCHPAITRPLLPFNFVSAAVLSACRDDTKVTLLVLLAQWGEMHVNKSKLIYHCLFMTKSLFLL